MNDNSFKAASNNKLVLFHVKYSILMLAFWYALMAKARPFLFLFACKGNDLKGVYGLFSIG